MTMTRITSHVLVLGWALVSTALLFAPPIGAVAQDVAGDEDEGVQEESSFEDFEKLVEGAEVSLGFFDLYMKEGRLYLAVPADRLGQEFLMDMRVARGIGALRAVCRYDAEHVRDGPDGPGETWGERSTCPTAAPLRCRIGRSGRG